MEEDFKLTLPSEEDLIGEDKLEIFKKYGITAKPTDLSQTSSYFTKSPADHGWVLCVGKNGEFEEKWVDSTEAIRPMLKLSSKMYEEVLELAGNKDEVEFGEYPQDLTDIPTEKKLNISLENDILLKTGRTFTINNNELEEYYYNGKKYICIDEEWFEVSPVKWLIDRKTKTLISKKCLLSEIDFNNELEYYGDFEETNIKWYLDTYMVKDLFQSIQNKEKEEEIPERKTSIQNKEIEEIIDKIYKLLEQDIFNLQEEENTKTKIDKLIEKYNKNIEKSFNNKSILVIENLDKKHLYNKLKSDLEDILTILQIKYEKYKEYISILELINNCINILENNPITLSTDLEQDIYTIKNNILPILEKEDKLIELKNIFINEKETIISIINGDENSKASKYKTLNDFIISIRKELQTYLLSVNKEITEKDSIKEIQESYLELALGQKVKSKNEYIKYILEEIEKNIKIINAKGNKKEQNKLKSLLSIKELDNDNLINSISKISKLFIETYKIVLNIEERELNNKEKEDYIIKR